MHSHAPPPPPPRCDYYCKYAPSWYFGLVAKGERACPIDPSLIDPLTPDPIYPGFGSNTVGRKLKGIGRA